MSLLAVTPRMIAAFGAASYTAVALIEVMAVMLCVDREDFLSSEPGGLHDERQSTHGWPLVFLALLCVGAAIFAWRGIVASTEQFTTGEIGTGVVTLAAVSTWVAGAVGILHNGRRMRLLAWVMWSINAVLPFASSVFDDALVAYVSPWFSAGATYFYLPTIGAILALIWLGWSSPSQIATRNGG